MSQERLAPQQPADCLIESRKSTSKGGTLIASDVWTMAEHRRRLSDPVRPYRPAQCAACEGNKLHVHDYRERHPLGLVMTAVVLVVRFMCANPRCRATWRVLPAFMARHMWWTWEAVESGSMGTEPCPAAPQDASPTGGAMQSRAQERASELGRKKEGPRTPSARTKQRWRARLASSAKQLVALLVRRGGPVLNAVALAVGLEGNRMQLVRSCGAVIGVMAGRRLAVVAALVDELERGVRLM